MFSFIKEQKPALAIISALIIALAFFLQIQITLFSTQDYIGLRINLADLILPLVGLAVLGSLLVRQTIWPNWQIKYLYVWLISLALVLTVSLINGYFTNGFFTSWALINKFVGFFILLSYLVLGGWLRTNNGNPDLFLKYFSGFFILVVLLSFICVLAQGISPVNLWLGDFNWDGFMANRNAFMLLAVFVLIVLETYRDMKASPFPKWLYAVFWTLIPFFALFNASRAGWIVGIIVLVVVFIKRPLISLKKLLPFLLLGAGLCFFIVSIIGISKPFHTKQFSRMGELFLESNVRFAGDEKRLIDIKDGLAIYAESNPIIGAGLGAYQEFQNNNRNDPYSYIIDFTALWLLVETGILGLGVFAAFFVICVIYFYKQAFASEPSYFHRSLFFFLIAFAFISIFHEITYSRFLWLALGMGLAAPKAIKQ